jgi:hypothetical protein
VADGDVGAVLLYTLEDRTSLDTCEDEASLVGLGGGAW